MLVALADWSATRASELVNLLSVDAGNGNWDWTSLLYSLCIEPEASLLLLHAVSPARAELGGIRRRTRSITGPRGRSVMTG
jgi:hypothetical protein